MAVSELSLVQLGAGNRSAARMLFERLPDRLFAPLASPNRHRYWALLCRLHAKRFGPDAPLPPSHGFVLRDVMQDIEDELVTQDTWENEDGNAQKPLWLFGSNVAPCRMASVRLKSSSQYFVHLEVSIRTKGRPVIAGMCHGLRRIQRSNLKQSNGWIWRTGSTTPRGRLFAIA